MSKFSKVTAAALAFAVLATGTANAATPKRVAFGLNNMTPNTCPAKVRLIANVFAKSQGWVQVQFQKKGSAPTPPQWLWVATKPSGHHRGKIEHILFPVPAMPNLKARVIVTGDGKTKTSNWDTLKVKC